MKPMQLLDHVSISVRDIDAARIFYDAAMTALGCEKVYDRPEALGYGARCSATEPMHTFLAIYMSADANLDDKRHWCFKAASQSQVRAFHGAALAHGGTCDGPPGLRPHYHASYYAAFVRDPQGNRIEAVCHVCAQAAG
jgi:catechol 2,3-dioxygenase-like lactoylglutathione lyase family enzyme